MQVVEMRIPPLHPFPHTYGPSNWPTYMPAENSTTIRDGFEEIRQAAIHAQTDAATHTREDFIHAPSVLPAAIARGGVSTP